MLSYLGLLMLCLSVTADYCVLLLRSGENLTVTCSAAGYVNNLSEITGVYFYRDNEKLTYYHNEPSEDSQLVTHSPQGIGRIRKTGSFKKLRITISNMRVSESGLYHCVYYSFYPNTYTNGSVYKVVVSEPTSSSPTNAPCPEDKSCPTPILVIVITATMSVTITMIVTLCIIPKVKGRMSGGGEPRDVRARSNDYVYEVMTRNGFHPDQR